MALRFALICLGHKEYKIFLAMGHARDALSLPPNYQSRLN